MSADSKALDRRQEAGQLATASPTSLIDSFRVLDIYAGGVSDEAPRVESIATISAGFRAQGNGDRPGAPQRSRDGTIYLHDATGRAAGLKRALERTGSKALTIAFPFDDPSLFIHCRFMRYSASALEAFGDETHLMVGSPRGFVRVEAGTEEYKRQLATCKVSVSVYFCLAEWTKDGPEIVFPDGVGAYYRLRFTSRHSLRSILSGLKTVGQFTSGRIAGVPFDLTIDSREVAGPDGKKRTIPVWTIAMRPSGGLRLSSGNFSEVMGMALEQGAALMLPAPSAPTLDSVLVDGPDDDLDDAVIEGISREVTDEDVRLIERGGRCNVEHYRNYWHSVVRGSRLDNQDGRAAFIRDQSGGRTESLMDYLCTLTDKEAARFIETVDTVLRSEQSQRTEAPAPKPAVAVVPTTTGRRSYRDLFGADDDGPMETSKTAFDRAAMAAEYTRLVTVAVDRNHKHAALIQAKTSDQLDDASLEGSVAKLQAWERTLPPVEPQPTEQPDLLAAVFDEEPVDDLVDAF